MFAYLKIFSFSFCSKIFNKFDELGIDSFLLSDGDFILSIKEEGIDKSFYFFELERFLKSEGVSFKFVLSKDPLFSFLVGRAICDPSFMVIYDIFPFLCRIRFFDIFPYVYFTYKALFNVDLLFLLKLSFLLKKEFVELIFKSLKKEDKDKINEDIETIFSFSKNLSFSYDSYNSALYSFLSLLKDDDGRSFQTERFVYFFPNNRKNTFSDFDEFKQSLFYFMSLKKIVYSKIDIFIHYVDGKKEKICSLQRDREKEEISLRKKEYKSFIHTISKITDIITKNLKRDVNIEKIILYIEKESKDNILFDSFAGEKKLFDSINLILKKYEKGIRAGFYVSHM